MNTAEMCFLNVVIIYFHGLGIVHSLSHCHGEGNRELEPNVLFLLIKISAVKTVCLLCLLCYGEKYTSLLLFLSV